MTDIIKPTYAVEKNRFPTVRHKVTHKNKRRYVDVAYHPDTDEIWSIFISGSKDGTEMRQYEEVAGILLSTAIQEASKSPDGKTPEEILKTLTGGEENLAAMALRVALKGRQTNV